MIKVIANHERDSEHIILEDEQVSELEEDLTLSINFLYSKGIYYFACLDGWTYRLEHE